MLTGWLWIHSPDWHRGVDVVCSNRSVLESTSSVVNERLLIPQVHQHKKGKITLTTAENSSGEVQKIDHAPTRLLIDRSTSSTFLLIHSSLSGIIQSTTELFWNLRLLFVRVEPVHRAWKPKESPLGWRRKPQETSDIGPGVKWWRKASVDWNDCVWCVESGALNRAGCSKPGHPPKKADQVMGQR